jgi:hypothetical protein
MGPLRALDHVQTDLPPGPQAPHPREPISRVRLIGPDAPPPGERVPQTYEHTVGAHAVLHVSRRDHHDQPQP